MAHLRLILPLLLLLTLISCREDPCASRICVNGGVCVDGTCDCPDGFIGPQCTVPLDPCITRACTESSTLNCELGNDGKARCICKDGFEGDVCADQWTEKILGDYTASEACNGLGLNFAVDVLDGPEFKKFTIANFRNAATDSLTAKVIAEMVNATVFNIPEQFMYFGVVTGFGSYNTDGRINLTYEVIDGKDTLLCVSTLSPQ